MQTLRLTFSMIQIAEYLSYAKKKKGKKKGKDTSYTIAVHVSRSL